MGERLAGRWSFVAAGFVINLCLGTIYAWSVFRPALETAPYGLSQSESVIPFSIFLLAFGISFAFSGRMIGHSGPRRPALIGAALLSAGYLLSSAIMFLPSSALWVTVVSFGLVAGTGCGFAYNPPIAVVGKWFPDKRGLALGLTVMGFGLSAVVTAPAVSALVSMVGLANTFAVLGAVFFVLLAVLGSLMRFPSADWKASAQNPQAKPKPWSASTFDFSTKQMAKTSTFYLSWFIFLIGAGAGLMIIGEAKQISLRVTGLTGDLEWLAVLAVQVLAVSNAVGRPLFGSVCDRIGPRKTLLAMQAIQLLCLVAVFPYATSAPVLYAGIVLFAATFGAYLSAMPALVSYFFGPKNLGPNYGMYLSAYGVGGVVCPLLLAAILGPSATYENYVWGFYVTAGLLVFAVLLTLLMRAPKQPQTA